MPSNKPCSDGAAICCTMLGSVKSTVSPAHAGIREEVLNSCFHLTATEVVHQTFDR